MRQNNRLLMKSSSVVLGATIFMGGVILSSPVFADDSVVDIINVTVPSTCTFGMGGGGTYARSMDTGETAVIVANNITTSCNDASGYAIYAIGFSGNSYSGTNTDLISNLNTNYNIKTDGTGSYGSSWKMKITAVTNATVEGSYGSFQNIPSTYAKVASYNTSTTEGTITPSYQINISNTQIADTYTGKVKYTLVHPATAAAPLGPLSPIDCPAYSICYAPNADDIVGSMSAVGSLASSATGGRQSEYLYYYYDYVDYSYQNIPEDIDANTTSVELIAPNYARSGYGFAGWSTDFEANNSSTIYGPNETIALEPGSLATNGLILYPVWIESAGDMQQWSGCSGLTAATYNSSTGKVSATLNQLTALTDTRDGNVYTVAKLTDGQCWMVENLRLNNEHTTSAADIAKAQGYGQSVTYGNFIGLASSEDNYSGSTPNDFYSSDGSTTINVGNTDQPQNRIPRYNNNATNMSANATNSSGVNLIEDWYYMHNGLSYNDSYRWYSYGNEYNWPAAMASTIYYSTYSGANGSDAAGTSICPKGWQLPLGAESTGNLASGSNDATNRVGGFSYLDRTMGGNGQHLDDHSVQFEKWTSFPNNAINSVYIWSRSASPNYGNGLAYGFKVSYGKFYPGTLQNGKNYQNSVRCISQ